MGGSLRQKFIGMKRTVSASSTTRSSVSSSRRKQPRFVICVDNHGYRASLLIRKLYRALDDVGAQNEGMLRVIDESGEDYLYDSHRFVPIDLARDAQQAVLRAE